jgi:hypothetical protein
MAQLVEMMRRLHRWAGSPLTRNGLKRALGGPSGPNLAELEWFLGVCRVRPAEFIDWHAAWSRAGRQRPLGSDDGPPRAADKPATGIASERPRIEERLRSARSRVADRLLALSHELTQSSRSTDPAANRTVARLDDFNRQLIAILAAARRDVLAIEIGPDGDTPAEHPSSVPRQPGPSAGRIDANGRTSARELRDLDDTEAVARLRAMRPDDAVAALLALPNEQACVLLSRMDRPAAAALLEGFTVVEAAEHLFEMDQMGFAGPHEFLTYMNKPFVDQCWSQITQIQSELVEKREVRDAVKRRQEDPERRLSGDIG